MRRTLGLVVLLGLLVVSVGWGSTYTVSSSANSGTGSLRTAIDQANSHDGNDTIVFSSTMTTISPTSALPSLSDDGTTIDGDNDTDGALDVTLSFASLGSGDGLTIGSTATNCTIRNLAIMGSPGNGLVFSSTSNSSGSPGKVEGCHFGANADDTTVDRNGSNDLLISGSSYVTVGGTTASVRNVFAIAYAGGNEASGLRIYNSTHITVQGNYFGLRPGGDSAYGGYTGIWTDGASNCTIGGSTAGSRNMFAADWGIHMEHDSDNNTMSRNYFGVWDDASGSAGQMGLAGIWLHGETVNGQPSGPSGNTIGGDDDSCRNVFAGGYDSAGTDTDPIGVYLYGPGTTGNHVNANYFGTNPAGNARRPLCIGVYFMNDGVAETIGGTSADDDAANYFVCYLTDTGMTPAPGMAIHIYDDATTQNPNVIRHCRFGLRPDGNLPTYYTRFGVYADHGSATTVKNCRFSKVTNGVYFFGDTTVANVWHNNFIGLVDKCIWAEGASNHHVALDAGNLDNPAPGDGQNVFDSDCTWAIYNEQAWDVKAEGNDFGTTSGSIIDSNHIYDKLDNGYYGRVDYDPLIGGVHPTGGKKVSSLVVAGAAAVPGGNGAEIAFTLSAPAQVTVQVLNLAGRLVATPAVGMDLEKGTRRVVWNRQSQSGTQVPAGRYLVRIKAQSADGETASALCTVSLK